jgi:hypothetical protein
MKISATNPPTLSTAWCLGPSTNSSPSVSQSDVHGSDAIVWVMGTDNNLYALDGDTGATLSGAGAGVVTTVQSIQVPIVANGRIFVAAANQVFAFAPGLN